jgi:hypothetical protein
MKSIENLISSLAFIAALVVAAAVFGAPNGAELMKEAKVSKAQAEQTALGRVHDGVIKSEELEREHGKLIWSSELVLQIAPDLMGAAASSKIREC